MDLIELVKDFTNSQNNDELEQNALLKQCLNASKSDLEELSNILPDTYLPTLQTFISLLCNENSRERIKKQNTALHNFISLLITTIIIKNLNHSDISDFVELLHNCIVLLQLADLNQTIKDVFSEILNTDGALGVLISNASGCYCLKCISFGNLIEQEELLRAVDMVAALVEECEHREFSYDLSKYKACTALLKTLRGLYKEFGARWNLEPLSIKDKQHLTLLRMVIPERSSDLPHFLQALVKRKIKFISGNFFFYLIQNVINATLVN
jgi:hypothetical protein